ncbi:hypothetical protein PMKS-003060 [Pichia membranifaciens]|uniref:Rab-GAP TBC domain-containing protein n=1 Tax=Pichia membranifaciens TaxID=4926 RepID=A0A1Q2YJ40_9ASCO|nr:hypothetical protein PMKS-003060 [Pichia membranifaciens]
MIRSTSYHKLNRKASLSVEKKQSIQKLRNRQNSLALDKELAENNNKQATHTKSKGRKKDVLEKFIESPQPLLESSLSQLRHSILCEGLPDPCPYRAYIWCILLRASPIESEWYSGVVARGGVNVESMGADSKFAHVSEKIGNDVFRTFQNNKKFWSKTSEDEFIRVLNAFAWCVIENNEIGELSNVNNSRLSPYVQDEVVKLWDFLFSYGVHMNIILVVAQLLLIRSELLTSKNPMSLLRQFPELDAGKIIKLSLSITKSIPGDLYDLIVRHTFDEKVGVQIENYKV